MSRKLWISALLVALLVFGATVVWAQTARQPLPLSSNHTKVGVSQYHAGPTQPSANRYLAGAQNPNNRGMLVAALVYERQTQSSGGSGTEVAETYVACAVKDLTKHHSEGFRPEDFTPDLSDTVTTPEFSAYVELIAAPRNLQTLPGGTQTRLADGLGIVAQGPSQYRMRALHPDMFDLPDDFTVPGQADAARTCVCDALDVLEDSNPNISEDTFSEFGSFGTCPSFTPPPAP